MITAEDKSSGMILRADVIVDKIHSLRIVTKTHELYLEETPEKFEVRAYDEYGNEFSTLRGIKFRWTIESGGGTAKGTDILINEYCKLRHKPQYQPPKVQNHEELLKIFWSTLKTVY